MNKPMDPKYAVLALIGIVVGVFISMLWGVVIILIAIAMQIAEWNNKK